MNHHVVIRVILVVLSIYLAVPFIHIFAKAYNSSISKTADVYDLWIEDNQQYNSILLYNHLVSEGLIVKGLSFADFDYICVLTQQLCSMMDNVTPDLAMAMMAVESNFDKDCKTGSARGLMQIIPIYHSKRLEQFVEDGHEVNLDDFFNPRLNIMTGIDYMDELLDKADGDVAYALMCYNQGTKSASKRYLYEHRVSSYAKKVMSLSKDIRSFIGEEASECL